VQGIKTKICHISGQLVEQIARRALSSIETQNKMNVFPVGDQISAIPVLVPFQERQYCKCPTGKANIRNVLSIKIKALRAISDLRNTCRATKSKHQEGEVMATSRNSYLCSVLNLNGSPSIEQGKVMQ